jgi:hypothetical protein
MAKNKSENARQISPKARPAALAWLGCLSRARSGWGPLLPPEWDKGKAEQSSPLRIGATAR